MRYMLLIYDCDRLETDSEAQLAKRAAVRSYARMLRERGAFRGADPLCGPCCPRLGCTSPSTTCAGP